MTDFIDPRTNPEPPPRVSRAPADHGDELRELLELCFAGRVYEVERWIQAGRPLQALTYKVPKKPMVVSPLRAAIRRRRTDVVLLLLCNGYRLELEAEFPRSVLDEALEDGGLDVVELLLKWGADPTKVQADNVLNTFSSDLIERFWQSGVDFTDDPGFIRYLASTVNKPLYGWLRRNRSTNPRLQAALDVALLEAVTEDEDLPAHLLLWAGAQPHRKVPYDHTLDDFDSWQPDELISSAEAAIIYGRQRLFERLRVAELPDLVAQVAHAHDCSTLKRLVAVRAPSDWSAVILAFIHRMTWSRLGAWDEQEALRFIASSGGRLLNADADEIRGLRRQLLELRADDFTWVVKWLRNEKHCERAIFSELTRTAAMQQKLDALAVGGRYTPPSKKMSRANERRQRARRKGAAAG